MTLARSTIEDAIYQMILSAGTYTNVIFYHPNAPRPEFPYTSIKFDYIGKSINPWTTFNKDTNLVEYWECRPMRYKIECYSDDALSAQNEAAIIQGKLVTYTIRKQLANNAPMSIQKFSDPVNATVLIDDAYESRSSFDIDFDVMIENGTTTDDLGYFNSVSDIVWNNYT